VADLLEQRPAPKVPVWLAVVVLVAALVATAALHGEGPATAATVVAVIAGWFAVAGMARRWTLGPWGAVAAAAAACGLLLLRDPSYRVLGVLFLVVGLLALPALLAIARLKRYADRLPDAPPRTDPSDLFNSNRVDPGSGPFSDN
jgi:O-antigen/teichoic acid export membrane protein